MERIELSSGRVDQWGLIIFGIAISLVYLFLNKFVINQDTVSVLSNIISIVTISVFAQLLNNKAIAEKRAEEQRRKHLEGVVKERTEELRFALTELKNEVVEKEKVAQELDYLAKIDVLTGLPNRKSFYDYLAGVSCLKSRRYRDGEQFALLFLDIDDFKNINDTLGHQFGDKVLQAFAVTLKQTLRNEDLLYRLGGDEFIVIINNYKDEVQMAKISEKIVSNTNKNIGIDGHDFQLSASIGISIYPKDGETIDELVKNADIAMYSAKNGKVHYRFFTESMNQAAQLRIRMEHKLREGLKHDRFTLHYQPIVDGEGKIIGFEALLRLIDPELGVVGPDNFISIAEDTGMIIPLGEWVLAEACREAGRIKENSTNSPYFAVNISARQFNDKGFVSMAESLITTSNLDPYSLKLELTESCIMTDPHTAINKMSSLRSLGVGFAIDDFGVGYSSLSYLRRIPFDTIKIDRSFVTHSDKSSEDREIIKTIISLANTLRKNTIAEGVTTQSHVDFLLDNDCQNMQGFYFSKPVTFEDAIGLVKSNQALGKTNSRPAGGPDKVLKLVK